jgi:hypothetical protein
MATAATQWVLSNPNIIRCSFEEIDQKINDNITQFQAGSVIDRSYCVNDQWFRLILNPHGHLWNCGSSPSPGMGMSTVSDKLRLFAQSENIVFQKIKTVFMQRKLQLPTYISNTSDSYFTGQQILLVNDNCQNCK